VKPPCPLLSMRRERAFVGTLREKLEDVKKASNKALQKFKERVSGVGGGC